VLIDGSPLAVADQWLGAEPRADPAFLPQAAACKLGPLSLKGSTLILVGPGRAGSALARAWTGAGGTLHAVIGRTAASAESARARLGAEAAFSVHDADGLKADVLVLAVPDDAIAGVASAVAGRVSARWAFHLSGALAADALEPLRRAGAATGSLHPLAPFTGKDGETWDGAYVAVEGEDAAAAEGERLAKELGGRGHRIRASGKPLYHAAATLAAGGTAALLAMAVKLWEQAGLPEAEARAALSVLSRRAAEAVGAMPFGEAITGPIARRDVGTLRAHARALREAPAAAEVYAALAEETLRQTPGRGSEEQIRRLLARDGGGRGPSDPSER
jgi:predicted short-subunit dehydrogenase-like oxidoreductase (DUF2520 family)